MVICDEKFGYDYVNLNELFCIYLEFNLEVIWWLLICFFLMEGIIIYLLVSWYVCDSVFKEICFLEYIIYWW